ncbi:MAG: hypothetical protein FJ311_16240 [Rhodospirillales bacterium]|nr:hypothetical protein [Rhodospirillales bacterium]
MLTTTKSRPSLRAGLLAAVGALTLSACSLYTGGAPQEGIGFREARFVEMSAAREWRKCRDEALELDRQARKDISPARYLASARLIEKCEAEAGPEAAKVAEDERMRAYALAVQNHLKGGDIAKAREGLAKLKTAYPRADLYYADGSSFTDTMDILLGIKDRSAIGEIVTVNVGEELQAEIRRAHYWKRN